MIEFLLLINQLRTAPVVEDKFLTKIAEVRCQEMAKNNDFSHDKFNSTYAKQIFKKYLYAGEILAKDFPNATSTVKAWQASPTHNYTMTFNKYTVMGCASCANYSVCLFGGKKVDTKNKKMLN